MNLKQTTALHKIWSLRSKIWGLQGGQGAGKTFSVLWLLCNHAFQVKDREIVIASGQLSKMKPSVIKDFKKIMKALGYWNTGTWNNQEAMFTFHNGSWVKFVGLSDKSDIGKGLRSHILYVNEANKVTFESYHQIASRADRIIIDFNPDTLFWYHKEIQHLPECQHLVLTYLDNEQLGKSEKQEIESYYHRGYNQEGKIINPYWANKHTVMALGQIGGVEGRIFYWDKCSVQEYEELQAKEYFGSDWGTADPFAVGSAKYYDGTLYVHELNYDSENKIRARLTSTAKKQMDEENEGLVTWLFKKMKIPKTGYIICDNNRYNKWLALKKKGWTRAIQTKKKKGSIIDGIDLLQNINVVFTATSENIEQEQLNYCWEKDKNGNTLEDPIDTFNHHIDWIRYVALFLQEKRIITRV